MIEEDYVSKPSPAKKPNLGNGPSGGPEAKTKEVEGSKLGHTNGIEMESDGEEEENLPLVPTVQVTSALLSFAVFCFLFSE